MKNKTKKEYLIEDGTKYFSDWVKFYPTMNSSFYVEKAGYFDERPCIHTSVSQLITLIAIPILCITTSLWFLLLFPFLIFGWGKLRIHLPIRTGIQDCDSAAWGINYHSNILWFYVGGGGNFEGGKKWKTIHMPWDLDWVRTSTLLSNGSWFHETIKNKKTWGDDKNVVGSYRWLEENEWKETHPFTDKYDQTTTEATISVVEREWRPRGVKRLPIFRKISRCIEVEFKNEVGKRKGLWKGGALGCGYELLPNETPLECLRRMEKEREF